MGRCLAGGTGDVSAEPAALERLPATCKRPFADTLLNCKRGWQGRPLPPSWRCRVPLWTGKSGPGTFGGAISTAVGPENGRLALENRAPRNRKNVGGARRRRASETPTPPALGQRRKTASRQLRRHGVRRGPQDLGGGMEQGAGRGRRRRARPPRMTPPRMRSSWSPSISRSAARSRRPGRPWC